MNKSIKTLYKCYLSKDKWRRLASIADFVMYLDGRRFFNSYSTKTDSILDFLTKCDKLDIKFE